MIITRERTKGVLAMKKMYTAPLVEYLAFSTDETIAFDTEGKSAWNDGELGWGSGGNSGGNT